MPRHPSTSSPTFQPPPSARYRHSGSAGTSSALSIWLSVDPMSDKYPGLSPYTYCVNNQVRVIDPDGSAYFEVGGKTSEMRSAFRFFS